MKSQSPRSVRQLGSNHDDARGTIEPTFEGAPETWTAERDWLRCLRRDSDQPNECWCRGSANHLELSSYPAHSGAPATDRRTNGDGGGERPDRQDRDHRPGGARRTTRSLCADALFWLGSASIRQSDLPLREGGSAALYDLQP